MGLCWSFILKDTYLILMNGHSEITLTCPCSHAALSPSPANDLSVWQMSQFYHPRVDHVKLMARKREEFDEEMRSSAEFNGKLVDRHRGERMDGSAKSRHEGWQCLFVVVWMATFTCSKHNFVTVTCDLDLTPDKAQLKNGLLCFIPDPYVRIMCCLWLFWFPLQT